MDYKLYTLVDITHTGYYRPEPGKEISRYKEQNFNTVLQTLGLRSNIWYNHSPLEMAIKGSEIGFPTDETIKVWRFDWRTEQDKLYEKDGDPLALLKEDFNLVPYIKGLGECMEQKYAVFNTGEKPNIVFFLKQ